MLLLLTVLTLLPIFSAAEKFDVAFQWNYINFTWPSPAPFDYVPGEDVIAGIKIYKSVVYLALPRIKNSARVTLASIPIDANKENPPLSPYPSWEMNSGSSCAAIQNVLSMEIDRDGVMWVLDGRRVDNNTDCPPRILLLDLNRAGEVVDSFTVPSDLCPWPECFLNDVVVAGDFAFVSDATASDPGLLVYDRRARRAWKARDASMFGDADAVRFTAQGVENTAPGHVNGVALCCDGTLFFSPQTSLHVFSVAGAVLRDPALPGLHDAVRDRGVKRGQSGGMVCDTAGDVYFGLMPLDAVARWSVATPLAEAEIVDQDSEIIKWPDSFAVYGGDLYLITNSISKFSRLGIDRGEINFRILKLRTNTSSYIYC